ncbi:MAG: hypothetical protein LBG05_01930 [Treponema sp.]|jgi:hypothetical protein|nr:hypothetical protein [Treponema sp.]
MSIFSSLPDVLSRIKGTIQTVFSKALSAKTSYAERMVGRTIIEEFHKHRRVFITGAGVIALLLLVFAVVLLINAERSKKPRSPIQVEKSKPTSIPMEDIFLPDEPDFLPNVILEKQPKKWDAQDARPFWTNPLENDPSQWQNNIKNTVDEIMEKTP